MSGPLFLSSGQQFGLNIRESERCNGDALFVSEQLKQMPGRRREFENCTDM